jgi:hypothetical protein
VVRDERVEEAATLAVAIAAAVRVVPRADDGTLKRPGAVTAPTRAAIPPAARCDSSCRSLRAVLALGVVLRLRSACRTPGRASEMWP